MSNEFKDFTNSMMGEIGESAEENLVEGIKKYLTFISDELYFAVDAEYVVEIITSHSVTHLPKLPEFVTGIINLRGQIIPIIDFRLRMGRPVIGYTDKSCIIVIDVNSIMMGLFVDSVSHVVDINIDDISAPPSSNRQEMVSGLIHLNGINNLILDCERLVQ